MYECDDDDDWWPRECHHGNDHANCELCDKEIEARGGIDKCMCCGRYKYGDELTKHQVCIRPCTNPNEY